MLSSTSSTQPAQQPPQGEQAPTRTVQRIRVKDWSGEHKGIDPLDDDNWQVWRDDIDLAFNVCGLRGYVNGEISCPDAGSDPVGADNWQYNDDYTKKVICDRVSRGQKHHLTNCKTAHEMWSNLKAIHQACGDQTENQLMRELTDTKANEGDNIIKHLAKIKRLWDRITLVSPDNLPLTPKLFKKFLAYSLPPTWDEFTRQFFWDPEKKNLTVPKFIGECHEEYRQRLIRGNENGQTAYAATNKPLAKHIGNATQKPNQGKKHARCTHCGRNNHSVENCYHIKKPKCSGCHKLGHEIDDCRSKKKSQSSTSCYNKDKKVADALVPVKQANIAEMDVKGAYLNRTLKETIYMRQPKGFADGSGRVCCLKKTLYGLKQSGLEWNTEFDNKMRAKGYKRLRADPCVYTRSNTETTAIITVWVDDLLLFAESEKTMEDIKRDIRTEWETTDLGEPSKIVGIEISMSPGKVIISQKQSIQRILEKHGLADANSALMPLDPGTKILPNPDGNEGNWSNFYAQLIGELQFVANSTRPDIAYAVNRLASYTANPSMQHVAALKRVLRYLAGTRDLEITYKHAPESPESFEGYADTAYRNRDDGKSITGYVFVAAGGAITWRSNKQSVTAISTTEAEYIALWESGKEASWLRNLYNELGLTQQKPTMLNSNSTGVVSIAKDPLFHKRTKHIDSKYHWVQEKVQAGRFEVEYLPTTEQPADVLTKVLPCAAHEKHVQTMGLSSV